MLTIEGKALLVITRLHELDEVHARYEVSAYIQSCSGDWEDREQAQEDFWHLQYDLLPLPAAAYKLAPGETIRVAVIFEFTHYRYSDGEADVDLSYRRERVRRRQKPLNRYVSKSGLAA